ncbi:hypothetical protein LCGC14_0342370 [marine sediment metagenome]|uniref:PglD N-terminal domain-containing protein n=1 Tax=marine sediment metagenome TaxID=412755 RepID=A0A0F9TD72_9ZZZZ
MKTILHIVGAGGFAKEVIQMIESQNHLDMVYYSRNEEIKISGLYIDQECLTDKAQYMGIPIWDIASLPKFNESSRTIIAIGNSKARKRIVEEVLPRDMNYYCIISSDINIKDFGTNLNSPGTIIARGNLFTTEIEIGKHSIINPGCTIGHDVKIGNYCTISPGCNISGNVKIGECVEIGTNTCIRENISICDDVIIGMGSVVVKDIYRSGIYYGNPAKEKDYN